MSDRIDPGPGWRLLNVGEVRPAGYEFWDGREWIIGNVVGEIVTTSLVFLRARAKEAAAISAANNRIRPEWCSEKTWKRWRAYQRMVSAGIPLEDYIDPVKRAEWKHKSGIRSGGTRRQRAEEILLRKGLHPSQRKAS